MWLLGIETDLMAHKKSIDQLTTSRIQKAGNPGTGSNREQCKIGNHASSLKKSGNPAVHFQASSNLLRAISKARRSSVIIGEPRGWPASNKTARGISGELLDRRDRHGKPGDVAESRRPSEGRRAEGRRLKRGKRNRRGGRGEEIKERGETGAKTGKGSAGKRGWRRGGRGGSRRRDPRGRAGGDGGGPEIWAWLDPEVSQVALKWKSPQVGKVRTAQDA